MPTRRGVAVGGGAAALLAAGLLGGYPELLALGTLGLLGLLVAFGWAGWPPRLTVRRTVEPDRVVRGEACSAVLRARSAARWRTQTLTGVEHLSTGRDVPVPALRLRPRDAQTLRYPLPTERRGVLDVGPLEVARTDPFGLVAARRRYGRRTRLWVHPRSHRLHGVPVGAARSLDGAVDAVQYGSITFHALREYVPGDDLRHVHWRTSARVGELMVREHVDTSLPRIVLLLDDRADAHRVEDDVDSLEESVETAASVLLAALRADLTAELHLVSGRHLGDAGGRAEGAGRYLDALAEVHPHDDASLAQAVRRLRNRHRGDTLVLVTGPGRPSDLDSVGLLTDVYPTVLVAVLGDVAGGPAGLPGVITLVARTAGELAARWDGVSAW